MKIYSLGVKFPYVTVSRIGKQLKDKERMLMRNVRILGFVFQASGSSFARRGESIVEKKRKEKTETLNFVELNF